jgi:hypothetical protein
MRLWPRTIIATDALNMIPGIDMARCRKPEIVADAAHAMLVRERRVSTASSCSTKTCCARPASPISRATRWILRSRRSRPVPVRPRP